MINDTKQLIVLYGVFCLFNLLQDKDPVAAGGAVPAVNATLNGAAIAYAIGLYYVYSSVPASQAMVSFVMRHVAVFYFLLNDDVKTYSLLTFAKVKSA